MTVLSIQFLLLKTTLKLERDYLFKMYNSPLLSAAVTTKFTVQCKSHNVLFPFAEQSDHQKRDFVGQLDKT